MVKKEAISIRNGVRKPSRGSVNRRIWEICDMVAQSKTSKMRKYVLIWCRLENINLRTASVEHCMWRKYNGLTQQLKGVKL